jgi:hypothetical protein
VKKSLGREAKKLEAAHWMALKKALSGQPVKSCLK